MRTLAKRTIVQIDEEKCDGCGLCAPACAEGAIQIIDGKARLVGDTLCDGMGACLGHCPRGAITVIEREAEAFDEDAVKRHQRDLTGTRPAPSPRPAPSHSRCPGARMMQFGGPAAAGGNGSSQPSALRQWPVQLTLVPPHAPFLQGADILLAADCVPFAFAGFHSELLAGKALLIACPKLDDLERHREKLAQIIEAARPQSITVAIMEVPCCRGLVMIAQEAAASAGIPCTVRVIGIQGQGIL